MDAVDYEQIQSRLQDSLRNLASSSGRIEDATQSALSALIKGYNPQQPKQSAEAAARVNLQGGLRKLCLDLVLEAQQKGQPPMQYIARGSAESGLQRLLSAVLYCCKLELLDQGVLLQLLDDVQEASIIEHCLDLISWLEGNMAVLAAPPFSSSASALNQVTRLCNSILKRLGKHEVMSKARLLMLIASVTPLLDRSGLGIPGAFAVADPPAAEPVPDGAVDSTGKPVDTLVYSTFWSLQRLLQDPQSLLTSADSWAAFKKQLGIVLAELAKSPATVPAARPAPAAAAPGAADAVAASGPAAAAAAAADAAAAAKEDEGTQCYLSSWKLFGLQLADSAFRRDFLVQVLVVLRTLLIAGKVPPTSLKPKERMEALALEKEVCKVLEVTPRNGKDFCRAVREALERETTWVGWKKGGKDFVVPGKEAPAAPAPAGANRRALPPPTSCIDWSKPPLTPPLAEAVGTAKADAEAKQAAQARRYEEGCSLKREVDTAGRQYDNRGEPAEDPRPKRAKYTKLLDGGSNVTLWARARVADRSLQSQPLLTGLLLSEQPQYPVPEAVCGQVIRESDPDSGIDKDYRRVHEDALYRWRIGRMVMQAQPDREVDSAAKLEQAMFLMLPDKLSADAKKFFEAEIAAEKKAKANKQQQQGQAGPQGGRRTPPPGAGGTKKQGPSAAAAAAGDKAAAGDRAAAAEGEAGDAAMKGAAAAAAAASTPTASAADADVSGAVAAGCAGEEVGRELDAEMAEKEEDEEAAREGEEAAAGTDGVKQEEGDGGPGSDEGELAGLAADADGEEEKQQQEEEGGGGEQDDGELAGLEEAAQEEDGPAGMEVDN